MATVDAEAVLNEKKSFGAKVSEIRRKSKELKMPWFPIAVLVILVICALFAPFVAPHDPKDLDVLKGVAKIGPFESAEIYWVSIA
jgi:ABC-type dipeptide/oligopeptide/nickel transport system permease subunit